MYMYMYMNMYMYMYMYVYMYVYIQHSEHGISKYVIVYPTCYDPGPMIYRSSSHRNLAKEFEEELHVTLKLIRQEAIVPAIAAVASYVNTTWSNGVLRGDLDDPGNWTTI